jgi:hypothetical protein
MMDAGLGTTVKAWRVSGAMYSVEVPWTPGLWIPGGLRLSDIAGYFTATTTITLELELC